MTDEDAEWMSLDQAVDHIVTTTGTTIEAARAALVEAIVAGRVRARGHATGPGGEYLGVRNVGRRMKDRRRMGR